MKREKDVFKKLVIQFLDEHQLQGVSASDSQIGVRVPLGVHEGTTGGMSFFLNIFRISIHKENPLK